MNENLILADLSGRDYLDLLGSAAPAPGGGAASALLGAQGCALGQMVCELTKGRAKYADSQKLVTEAAETLSSLRSELLSLADEDAQGYQGVMDVFALPKTSEEEILRRKTALEAALQACTKTPFRVMQRCEEGLQVIRTLLGRTNRNASSDLAVGALDLKAAFLGAWLNVKTNTASLSDRAFAAKIEADGQAIIKQATALADHIYLTILNSFS